MFQFPIFDMHYCCMTSSPSLAVGCRISVGSRSKFQTLITRKREQLATSRNGWSYRNLHMGFRMTPNSLTLDDLKRSNRTSPLSPIMRDRTFSQFFFDSQIKIFKSSNLQLTAKLRRPYLHTYGTFQIERSKDKVKVTEKLKIVFPRYQF